MKPAPSKAGKALAGFAAYGTRPGSGRTRIAGPFPSMDAAEAAAWTAMRSGWVSAWVEEVWRPQRERPPDQSALFGDD